MRPASAGRRASSWMMADAELPELGEALVARERAVLMNEKMDEIGWEVLLIF